MKRAANQTVVVIYRVEYTEHCEYSLRTRAIDNESLDCFYALAGCMKFIIIHYIKYIIKIC